MSKLNLFKVTMAWNGSENWTSYVVRATDAEIAARKAKQVAKRDSPRMHIVPMTIEVIYSGEVD